MRRDNAAPNEPREENSIWGASLGDVVTLYDLDLPDLGPLGINWISPGYQYDIDWNMLPNNGTGKSPLDPRGQQTPDAIIPTVHDMDHSFRQQTHQSTSLAIETSSCDSAQSTQTPLTASAEYYVNGDGSRAPFRGRYHDRGSLAINQALPTGLKIGNAPEAAYSSCSSTLCSEEAYGTLLDTLRHHGLDSIESGIESTAFPTHAQIELYVQQYFARFNPVFPFLRKTTFEEESPQRWLLLLAVAAIGSRFVPGSRDSYNILSERLDAALDRCKHGRYSVLDNVIDNDLYVPGENLMSTSPADVQTLQAGILHLVCLMQSGTQGSMNKALRVRHDLVNSCRSLKLLELSSENSSVLSTCTSPGSPSWLRSEARIRTGISLWLFDCSMMYEFGVRPLLNLDDVRTKLPSCEDIWQGSLQNRPEHGFPQSMTLTEALEVLYMEKRLPVGLNEFSVGLLIHAIYRHTKDMLTASRLRSWIPSAMAEHRSAIQHNRPSLDWLPSTQIGSKWRNSACDSLDILHWHANSKVATSSGFEHHTILQLHLARITILTPTGCIQSLARDLTDITQYGAQTDSRICLDRARNELLQWVVEDKYKTRLAVIHCAALYWHVRRYSRDSVQEPYAIFIATLTLWSFCVTMQLPEASEAIFNDRDGVPEPSFCHLDRPLDDELVQLFVRVGHRMCPNISRVGNILDPQAAPNILREGRSLLLAGSRARVNTDNTAPQFTWGIEECYVKSLSGILETMARAERNSTNQSSLIFPWCLALV
ncbi:hypothetical protein COCSADRAFT_96188 [Bipolaris sorokiniana ND90Pr]|uniref:Xylanolytic transcriptional activator regulatory domain-containing protein n=1 Tax=Cochliobolus sativus (strain ND90Pr / ATCC 201652) TaxID=665912 RepID=M2R1Z4_COCSN|nr:uncharacterized protein COCSADRAFT_96188 [Bipolaris sorokiniana ND90Pr]EMD61274.1 hypothetical protein COCSADRAFT_96188 [Bipolaris sorokiniana ND90Pr]